MLLSRAIYFSDPPEWVATRCAQKPHYFISPLRPEVNLMKAIGLLETNKRREKSCYELVASTEYKDM